MSRANESFEINIFGHHSFMLPPANIYLIRVNTKNIRKSCQICSKLIMKILEKRDEICSNLRIKIPERRS